MHTEEAMYICTVDCSKICLALLIAAMPVFHMYDSLWGLMTGKVTPKYSWWSSAVSACMTEAASHWISSLSDWTSPSRCVQMQGWSQGGLLLCKRFRTAWMRAATPARHEDHALQPLLACQSALHHPWQDVMSTRWGTRHALYCQQSLIRHAALGTSVVQVLQVYPDTFDRLPCRCAMTAWTSIQCLCVHTWHIWPWYILCLPSNTTVDLWTKVQLCVL